MWIKKICKFYGNTNAPLDNVNGVEKALIISKVNKANFISGNETTFAIYIIGVEFLIWFIILERIVGNMHILRIFGLFTTFYILCLLVLQIVVQTSLVGDTIIFFEDKIVKLNWLYSREILWSKVNNIYFCDRRKGGFVQKYLIKSEDVRKKFQEKLQNRLTKIVWINIKIEASNKKIFINTAYSHNEELQKYIKEKHGDKIKNNEVKGIEVNPIGLLMLGGIIIVPFIGGVVYLLNYFIG